MDKWKFLRNVCIIWLYAGIFLTKPSWCLNPDVDEKCSINTKEDISYFTNMKFYLQKDKVEITSWLLMVVLLVYDLILVEL